MPKQVPTLSNAPRPLAPYSVATEANGFVFISGQVALDRSGGPTPDDVVDQTRLIMDNIGSILEDLGLGYSDIVKTTVFLSDIDDFGRMNEVYGSCFGSEPPARSTFQVAALPRAEFKIEIEAVVAR
ncbi:MAG TPA: Rid family detoxifying hydrolase [Acidimicrobiia bacterium]|nr:Rid family detoxifying hydrolase [Acidimicrobiia bacterium]